jgi:hypothetical protein
MVSLSNNELLHVRWQSQLSPDIGYILVRLFSCLFRVSRAREYSAEALEDIVRLSNRGPGIDQESFRTPRSGSSHHPANRLFQIRDNFYVLAKR